MKNKQSLFLVLVMLCALAVMAVLTVRMLSVRKEASALSLQLEESTSNWKKTNEDKVALQKELTAAREELREAELTLEESRERAEKLRQDIASLESEIETLTGRIAELQSP